MNPVRIQLRRSKGFKLQETSRSINGLDAIKVDRTTPWGNPFVVGKKGGVYTAKVMHRRHAWQLYRSVAMDNEKLVTAAKTQLRGKNLACWCPHPDNPYDPDECHAAVLLEIANG